MAQQDKEETMSGFEEFDVDEDFDPFATESLDDLEDEEPDNEYSAPVIPDADKSVIPEQVQLPGSQRIKKLLRGMPAQQFRVLAAIRACKDSEKTLEEIIKEVDSEFQKTNSVFSTGRIVQLLERAGAIKQICQEQNEVCQTDDVDTDAQKSTQETSEENEEEINQAAKAQEVPSIDPGQEFVEIQRAKPSKFIATQDGIDAYEASIDIENMQNMLSKEPQYLPVYKRILTMCNIDGGRIVQEINAVIDPDPICAKPRRYATYFLHNLEDAGALRFADTWITTDYGKKALELGLLIESEQVSDDKAAEEAAASAKEKQLAKEAKFEAEKEERDKYYSQLEAEKQAEIAKAIEAGEPLQQEKPKHGSGGPLFAFPYTPAEDEETCEQSADDVQSDNPLNNDVNNIEHKDNADTTEVKNSGAADNHEQVSTGQTDAKEPVSAEQAEQGE